MATMEEMQSNMTIYYSKSTGDIKAACTGIQDMNFFGANKDDFSLIWDFIVLARNDAILNNTHAYKVSNGQLELK